MVAGLKFLSKKGFNPQNLTNQKRVWVREQETKLEADRIRERQQQLQRERDDEELALARGDTPRLKFMYDVPTHTDAADKEQSEETKHISIDGTSKSPTGLSTMRQPGDDDAAAEFRRMLAAAATGGNDESNDCKAVEEYAEGANYRNTAFSTILHGSSAERMTKQDTESQKVHQYSLEKAVGKKQSINNVVTLEEQIERFPALKNAPRAKGMTSTDIGVSFKPLGAQIRNVKCLVCGIWGHSKGDRECRESGWDPFAIPSSSIKLSTSEKQRVMSSYPTHRKKQLHEKETVEDYQRKIASSKNAYDSDSASCSDDSSSYERKKKRKRSKERKRKEKKKRKSRKEI